MAAAEAAMVAHAWSIVSLAASAKASAAGMRDEDTANVESSVNIVWNVHGLNCRPCRRIARGNICVHGASCRFCHGKHDKSEVSHGGGGTRQRLAKRQVQGEQLERQVHSSRCPKQQQLTLLMSAQVRWRSNGIGKAATPDVALRRQFGWTCRRIAKFSTVLSDS